LLGCQFKISVEVFKFELNFLASIVIAELAILDHIISILALFQFTIDDLIGHGLLHSVSKTLGIEHETEGTT